MTGPATRHRGRLVLPNGSTGLIITLFLIPAPFEIAISIIKREEYDFTRLAVVLGALALVALILVLARRPHLGVTSVLGYFLVLIGLALLSVGIVINFRADAVFGQARLPAFTETALSALTPSSGLLLAAAGVYLVIGEIRRAAARFERQPPTGIASPQRVRVSDLDMAIWRSPAFIAQSASEDIIEVCQGLVTTKDLHYVSMYDPKGDCSFCLDVLDDAKMRRFNLDNTADRRGRYEQIGRYLRRIAAAGDRRLGPLRSGLVLRLVLDVERGAIYLYRLRDLGFLVGVTLDQSMVDSTDRKLTRLANDILTLEGGRREDTFFRVPDYHYDTDARPGDPVLGVVGDSTRRDQTG